MVKCFKHSCNRIHSDCKILWPSGQEFSWNKFLLLAGPKSTNFVDISLAIGWFIVNCTAFLFAIDRFGKVAEWNSYEIIYKKGKSFSSKLRYIYYKYCMYIYIHCVFKVIYPRTVLFCTFILRKKCPCSELFWSVFSGIRTEYREIFLISPFSVRIRENTDQNNSEYGHFSRKACLYNYIIWFLILLYPNSNTHKK